MKTRAALITAAIALFLFFTIPTAEAAPKPPGNNGHVFIDDNDLDGNGNDPHVQCPFYVDYYGFDEGTQTTTLTFESQPPTGDGLTTIFNTSFTGHGTGNTLDLHYGPVDLSSAFAGVTPQQNQGFHVKLTTNTSGSQGADVKHKVFWMEPCESETTTTTIPETTTTTQPEQTTTTVPEETTTTIDQTTTTSTSIPPRETTTTVPEVTTTVPETTTTTGVILPTTTITVPKTTVTTITGSIVPSVPLTAEQPEFRNSPNEGPFFLAHTGAISKTLGIIALALIAIGFLIGYAARKMMP